MKCPTLLLLICILFTGNKAFAQSTGNTSSIAQTNHDAYFPGGDSALYNYIYSHVILPKDVIKEGLSGMVVVSFVVNADSTLSEITIKKTYHPGCGEAVLKVFEEMPKWIPAITDGKAICSTKYVPVKFKLEPKTVDWEVEYFEDDSTFKAYAQKELDKKSYKENLGYKGMVILRINVLPNGRYETEILQPFSITSNSLSTSMIENMPIWKINPEERKKFNKSFILPLNFGLDKVEFDKRLEEFYKIGPNKNYELIEESASYPTGNAEMMKFIQKNLIVPDKAIKEKIEGIVVIEFVVEKDGTLTNIKIIKDIGGGCGDAAVNVVMKMPIWKPATINGEPVKAKMKMPIKIRIPEQNIIGK